MLDSYLGGYPETIRQQIQGLIDRQQLAPWLASKYPTLHQHRSDKALYHYTMALKSDYLKQSATLSKVVYDDKIQVIRQALGLHSFVSRVQGSKLKAKNEIRIAAVFRRLPEPMLRMIVVHELAHLREKAHDKAFYKLCQYMMPDYHQLELETRLALLQLEIGDNPWPGKTLSRDADSAGAE